MAGPCICILCLANTCASYVDPVCNPVAPYGYMFPTVYGRYRKSRLVCVWLSGLDLSQHHLILFGAAPAIQRVRMTGLSKKRQIGSPMMVA